MDFQMISSSEDLKFTCDSNIVIGLFQFPKAKSDLNPNPDTNPPN